MKDINKKKRKIEIENKKKKKKKKRRFLDPKWISTPKWIGTLSEGAIKCRQEFTLTEKLCNTCLVKIQAMKHQPFVIVWQSKQRRKKSENLSQRLRL